MVELLRTGTSASEYPLLIARSTSDLLYAISTDGSRRLQHRSAVVGPCLGGWQRAQMSAEVRDSYDAMADLYVSLNLDALDHDTNARKWLAVFAKLAAPRHGVVTDLGCGPGHVVHHLSGLDLSVIGYDLSEGQIVQARRAFPDSEFHVGDLAALDVTDSSIGGIVSRYSIIHIAPSLLSDVFDEWMRVLEPEAPVLVSFFGSLSADTHGTPFDHKVATAYELFPRTIARQLQDAGFVDIEVGVCPTPDGVRPFYQATVLAIKPGV